MTQTSSGIEPLFLPYYTRKRKCSTDTDKVDFIDKQGIKYSEFVVVHFPFACWCMDFLNASEKDLQDLTKLDEFYKISPWYKSSASEINWQNRIKIQQVIQKYTTHAISSTINLLKTTTQQEISTIYMEAWRHSLKGITVYRDGCRDGILTSIDKKSDSRQAQKRPKVLEADYYQVKVKGIQYIVLVGLLDDKPYEIFTFKPLKPVEIESHKGIITKIHKGQYSYNSDFIQISDLQSSTTNIEEKACTLYASMLLRHGADIPFIIKTSKKVDDNISSFASAMCRILAKYSTKEEIKGEVCPNCGGRLLRESGCIKCLDCDFSKCL